MEWERKAVNWRHRYQFDKINKYIYICVYIHWAVFSNMFYFHPCFFWKMNPF